MRGCSPYLSKPIWWIVRQRVLSHGDSKAFYQGSWLLGAWSDTPDYSIEILRPDVREGNEVLPRDVRYIALLKATRYKANSQSSR